MSEVSAIPFPPAGEIVSARALVLSSGSGVLDFARAFGGTSDPTRIWEAMIANSPESFSYYCDLEEKDDDIGGLLETLKLGVLGRKRKVQPADDSAKALRVAEFIEKQLNSIPDFHQVLHSLLDAPGYGLSVAEITFDISSGQVGVLSIRDCPQECFSFADQRWQPQIGKLRFLTNPYAASGDLVPEEKFLIFSYNSRKRNRFGRPLLRRAFWPSWFKRNAICFWLRFAEKGPGTAAVKYPQGASEDEQRKALSAAEALIEKVAVAVPANFEMVEELLTSARSQNPAVYERLVQRNELAIARAILGETLTSHGSEQGAGSYSLGQVHQEMFQQRVLELARALEEVVNDQLVRRLVLWNFGARAPIPKWVVDTGDPGDLSARIRIEQVLQQMGLPITANYLRSRYSVPQPADGDEVLHLRAAVTSSASPEGIVTATFSENRQVRHEAEEVQRLMSQMKADAFGIYKARVEQIAEEVLLNHGGLDHMELP